MNSILSLKYNWMLELREGRVAMYTSLVEGPGSTFRFEAFSLDARTLELRKQGRVLRLNPKPTQLLLLLVSRAGGLVNREEIRHALWNDQVIDFDRSINSYVRQIRDVLGDESEAPRFIETVPRRGYRFVASVEEEEADQREASTGSHRAKRIAMASGGALMAAWLVWGFGRARPLVPADVVSRFELDLGAERGLGAASVGPRMRLSRTAVALSSSGERIAFEATEEDSSWIFVRWLSALETRPLDGTERGIGPFFSPDGTWIGFWRDGALYKVPSEGGVPIEICELARPHFGASWGPGDRIVFATERGPLLQVHAAGGEPVAVTALEEGETSHRLPQVLGERGWVLFTVTGPGADWSRARVEAVSLNSGERLRLLHDAADARYSDSGHLVFAREGNLLAASFDADRMRVTGGPVGAVDGVHHARGATNFESDTGAAQFAIARNGTLVYAPGGPVPEPKRQIVRVKRGGQVRLLPVEPGSHLVLRNSPDGERFLVQSQGANRDLWLLEAGRRSLTRLTSTPANEVFPVWTPDGSRVAFASDALGDFRVFSMPADRSEAGVVFSDLPNAFPAAFTPDGDELIVVRGFDGKHDLWAIPKEGAPRPILQTEFDEVRPALSPDGRWLAYDSNEGGRRDVFVTPFPGPGPKYRVSVDGGLSAAWSADGDELYFIQDGVLYAVPIRTEHGFESGSLEALFSTRGRYVLSYPVRNFDVLPDGTFLMTTRGEHHPEIQRLVVVMNWPEELRARYSAGTAGSLEQR